MEKLVDGTNNTKEKLLKPNNETPLLDMKEKPKSLPKYLQTNSTVLPIDTNALSIQILEKKNQKEYEREQERKYEAFNHYLNQQQIEIENRLILAKKMESEKLNDYRLTFQKKEYSREFDLNDPKLLFKSLPMCTGDNDPRISSKGSLLRFNGEDYDGKRGKSQGDDLKQQIEQQIAENDKLRKSIRTADAEWVQEWLLDTAIDKQCIAIEAQAKKSFDASFQAYNLLLAKEKQIEKKNEKLRNEAESFAHIHNVLTSNFFLESSNAIGNSLSENKINPNYYKGLTVEQLSQIKHQQLDQIIERKSNEDEEKANERYMQLLDNTKRQNDLAEMQKEKLRKLDECRRIRDFNLSLAVEQKENKRKMEKMAVDNDPTDEYYSYFNRGR